ncbi:MAG: carbonic anhydrase [Acidobacteriota bacterium]
MIGAREALARLREGNRRFVAGVPSGRHLDYEARRGSLLAGQEPFAVVLGCSDSRVPVEIVFDQGLGDLFVIRVAGNVVAPSQVGSVEFAAVRFGTRLVVVLGHTGCGAVLAALEDLRQPAAHPRGLRAIVERIRPAIEGIAAGDAACDADGLLRRAVEANVLASVDRLRHGSDVVEELIAREGLLVVGAVYSLASGAVDFLRGPEHVGGPI